MFESKSSSLRATQISAASCVSVCLHEERVLGTGFPRGFWKVATWGQAAEGGLSPTEGWAASY